MNEEDEAFEELERRKALVEKLYAGGPGVIEIP